MKLESFMKSFSFNSSALASPLSPISFKTSFKISLEMLKLKETGLIKIFLLCEKETLTSFKKVSSHFKVLSFSFAVSFKTALSTLGAKNMAAQVF